MEIYFIHKDIKKFLDDHLDQGAKSKYAKVIELLIVEEYKLSMPYSKKSNRIYMN